LLLLSALKRIEFANKQTLRNMRNFRVGREKIQSVGKNGRAVIILQSSKLLPVHAIPSPRYPVKQEHVKLPKVFVHDPPLAGFAQLSVPSAHSSMSVVSIHRGSIKSYSQMQLNEDENYHSLCSCMIKVLQRNSTLVLQGDTKKTVIT